MVIHNIHVPPTKIMIELIHLDQSGREMYQRLVFSCFCKYDFIVFLVHCVLMFLVRKYCIPSSLLSILHSTLTGLLIILQSYHLTYYVHIFYISCILYLQWDLVCDKRALVPTASSVYMAGLMVGVVIFGFISDQ